MKSILVSVVLRLKTCKLPVLNEYNRNGYSGPIMRQYMLILVMNLFADLWDFSHWVKIFL